MFNKLFFLHLFVVLSQSAYSIETHRCPEELSIRLKNVQLFDEDRIFELSEFVFERTEEENKTIFNRHLSSIRLSRIRLASDRTYRVSISERRNGICTYKDPANYFLTIQFRTKNLRNYIQLEFGDVVLFATIRDLTPKTVVLANPKFRKVRATYGEINPEGNNGDMFHATLGTVDLSVRVP